MRLAELPERSILRLTESVVHRTHDGATHQLFAGTYQAEVVDEVVERAGASLTIKRLVLKPAGAPVEPLRPHKMYLQTAWAEFVLSAMELVEDLTESRA